MKRLKYLSIVACMALLIASCNKQTSTEPNTIGEGVAKITLRLSDAATYAATEPGVDDENHIKELKIFIFDQASKAFERVIKIDPKQSTVGNDMWDNTSNTLVMRDFPEPTRLRNVYVIANWAVSDAELANIATEQLLVASLTELTGAVAVPTKELPLLMSGKAESHNFSTEKSLTVDVKRQVVKIELTVSIDAKFLAAFPKYIFGEAKVQLHNAPKSSYVCEQQSPALPAGNVMFKYDAQTMIASGATQVATLYVYENPAMGVNAPLATFFTLQLPYTNNGVTTDKNYYKLTINNSGDTSNPSRTLRNTFYKMNVRVLGFGTEVPNQNSVDITTNVLPWDGEDILSDDGKMLTLSAASVDLDEADEQIIVDYKGGKLNSAQLSGDAASHIDLTISEIDDNSGTITLKRKDELHRGLKYIGKLTVNCASPLSYDTEIPVSIEQYSVNFGGVLTTTTDGKRTYWAGGTNWATANLTIQNSAQNTGMMIASDPTNAEMFFKWQSRIGMYGGVAPWSLLHDGTGLSPRPSSVDWTGVLAYHDNEDPCKNAGKFAGTGGAYNNGYWRQPTKEESFVLVNLPDVKPQPGTTNITYKKRLLLPTHDYLVWDDGREQKTDESASYWTSTNDSAIITDKGERNGNAWSYFPFGKIIQPLNINYGFKVRCVRTNPNK